MCNCSVLTFAKVEPSLQSFDGRKLFLPMKLENVVTQETAKHSVTGAAVLVKINFKSKREMGADRDVIQHYNILFNRIMRVLKFSQHNRNFFDPKAAINIKQHNLQVKDKIESRVYEIYEYRFIAGVAGLRERR